MHVMSANAQGFASPSSGQRHGVTGAAATPSFIHSTLEILETSATGVNPSRVKTETVCTNTSSQSAMIPTL